MQPIGPVPRRQIRASFTATTITVYQAYTPAIAEAALAAGRFVPPFRSNRMTWIKPSFLWMAYRSGWASKPDQERVLAVEITRDGFCWALQHACLSSFEPETYDSHASWVDRKQESAVRVQWDPERDLNLQPLDHRAIQIGLGESAVQHYVDEWIVGLSDVTGLVQTVHELVRSGQTEQAETLLPIERPFPLTSELIRHVGATPRSHDK